MMIFLSSKLQQESSEGQQKRTIHVNILIPTNQHTTLAFLNTINVQCMCVLCIINVITEKNKKNCARKQNHISKIGHKMLWKIVPRSLTSDKALNFSD